ncbi:bi-domain-containing oxidoreductase [Porticoccaceae bacterium LTM1]|nr:bi-domain-containing oxidoreductase [Porticoccaceae bacterium LTM1]
MKQILQNISNGETHLSDVPCPEPRSGQILIKTESSLVSVGTERMLIDFGKANWIEKARQQPDKVKMVLDKVKTDGLLPTLDAVRSKLDQPLPLGYCNVGTVVDSGGSSFTKGDRVVSNGHHAQIVRVPKNLVVKIPDSVDNESAAFTVLGSIAMQGVRLAEPTIGETFVVTGLGLIGLLTVQILKANGCRVIGLDFDSKKCELAREFGAETVDLSKGEDPIQIAASYSRGSGVDGVIITASSKSNEIIHQAATMCRKRARIILVGVVGLELRRSDFYEKELTFQVSCSYGPGRYDDSYELKGNDYPLPFVRWTEQRNFEAVLDLMASGALNVKPLVSHTYSFFDALDAYKVLEDRSSLGILLTYPRSPLPELLQKSVQLKDVCVEASSLAKVSFVGAGNYASRVLIPAFKKAGATLGSIITSGGVSAAHHGAKNSFQEASTEFSNCLKEDVDAVVIATRHDLHAAQTIESIKSGKHVFVEKPLALTLQELSNIEKEYKAQAKPLSVMVGFNRRFAPHIKKMKELISSKKMPKTFIMTMNAGNIPSDHWTQDPEVGGGRIIGEACHYIDLMRFLVGAPITGWNAIKVADDKGLDVTDDKAIITLSFEDGSIGSIHYFANGGKSFPKERVEVFCDDAVLQLDNFRKLRGHGWKGFSKLSSLSQDKGQNACAEAFIRSLKQGGEPPISFEEILEVSRVSIEVANSLR